MAEKIEYIAFDLGRVLVDWNPAYLFDRLIDDAARRQYMLEHVVTMDWIEEVDRGKALSRAVAERIIAFPDYTVELMEYGARWMETLPGLIHGTVALKRRLKGRGYPLYALSNFGRDTYADAVKAYPELADFDGAVISGHEGVIKPEPEIYQILLSRYNLVPEKLLFIDDRADNVAQAQAMGIQAVQFHDAARLEEDLTARAVL